MKEHYFLIYFLDDSRYAFNQFLETLAAYGIYPIRSKPLKTGITKFKGALFLSFQVDDSQLSKIRKEANQYLSNVSPGNKLPRFFWKLL